MAVESAQMADLNKMVAPKPAAPVPPGKVKRPPKDFKGCKCEIAKCLNSNCTCRKNGYPCTSKCKCQGCENILGTGGSECTDSTTAYCDDMGRSQSFSSSQNGNGAPSQPIDKELERVKFDYEQTMLEQAELELELENCDMELQREVIAKSKEEEEVAAARNAVMLEIQARKKRQIAATLTKKAAGHATPRTHTKSKFRSTKETAGRATGASTARR